ncbi:glycoside hydrolase superfamily [Xylaria bambusicola]|uniref:glycoside hydrolase superfamily n=1 Tax=Xylaria bambusicola TaxID=326684 RepID=UPI002007A6C8|nr:glycoside hydrolase superfamily [Xylaria bambusicola]KAI0506840.1 glycoside hydrolase superfamily [Xylaria bambusicola]
MLYRLFRNIYLISAYLGTHYVDAEELLGITHQSPERALPELGPPYSGFKFAQDGDLIPLGSSTTARNAPNPLQRRQREEDPTTGALLCMKAPCVDGSCCGPAGICGYGPDFCGTGCTSNCDAKAMCGRYSVNGTESCGMNICCSWGGWCGTTEAHCIQANQFTPCQVGYGQCEIIRPKLCGEDSGTTKGRSIGYYQASNSRDRICNRITPDQIQTDGYTHLFFAFASVDPKLFTIKPWDENDIPLMTAFTGLKTSTLQTWIAVGGYDFSDKDKPTHTTWSDLCANADSRATFIRSAMAYMDQYGFQGMDLDWEYPVAPERGGQPGDTQNFVKLVKEMKEAFGTNYGLSLTLAPDYWYLRNFDPKAMEPYVDFFSFMAYDLHGSWDSDVLALGALVRGQADVREIYNDTLPLFYDALDPSKINFGLAWYGRGYTLFDPSCNQLLCPFKGPSKAGKCTGTPGVMSLREVQQLIAEKGLKPRLNNESLMKELSWADQWIGYDDEETHALKRKFANNLCFGGTVAWSVDFNSGPGDGDQPPVSTDGSCGSGSGGKVCEGSGFGDCCSAHGFCGSTSDHCGNGCQSGRCFTGGETTDGTCGAGYNDIVCGLWPQGSCCSPAGFCGRSADHCGPGCQSGPCWQDPDGKGSGDVYIDNTVYVQPSPTVQCFPPCTLVFPPSTMPTATTLSFAPFTTALTIGSSVATTVLRPSPVTTSVIWFSNLPISSGQDTGTFALTTSVVPSPITISLNGLTSTVNFSAIAPIFDTTSTTPIYYTLPTTLYSTKGTTQYFSEDQITTLSGLTEISTSTTVWVDIETSTTSSTSTTSTSTSTTSSTVVPIIIGPGGFYWSPIPFPTGPKFPIPNLPSPPPIPSPSCFKYHTAKTPEPKITDATPRGK